MSAPWDDFRFVLALKRAGSVGDAAKLLGCSESTVSERIAALQTALGFVLVNNTPAGLALSDAGASAAALAETFDHGIAELVQRIGGDKPEGVVKLASTDGTAMYLMSGLAPLREAHPKLKVELLVANVTHDLLRGEADLALRMFRDPNPALISEKIGDLGWSVFASPAYLAKAPVPSGVKMDAEALVGHAVLGFAAETARSPGGKWVAANARPQDITKRTGNMTAVINAAKNGLGLAVLPCFVVRGIPELVRVTPDIVANSEAFLVFTPEQGQSKRVRIVIDAVTALFAREHDVAGAALT